MSPTLLELAVIGILIIVAWPIGLAIAPAILRALRALRRDVDAVAEEAASDPDRVPISNRKEESIHETRHRS